MSSDTFSNDGDQLRSSDRPFDDGYIGYDPRLPSQRFDSSSFSTFDAGNYSTVGQDNVDIGEEISNGAPLPASYRSGGFSADDKIVGEEAADSPIPYGFNSVGDGTHPSFSESPFADSIPASNGSVKPYNVGADEDGIFASDGPVLPPPDEMMEEGFALREWRRQNFIRLEEKENREKEMRNQIIEEAEEYKRAFYEKRKLNIETNKTNNRSKEKVYLTNQENFHKEADKQYWKAIAELIPHEVPNIEKRGKKDQEKKPSITVIHGPKPGKPTDLSRLRHILVKLKHSPPPHLVALLPPTALKDGKSGRNSKDGGAQNATGPAKNATSNGSSQKSEDEAPTAADEPPSTEAVSVVKA
ncbi:hypothetical protein Nepgr_028772 [Nepenthes gracilis]|uniref:Clathrin light chain n=1 Tax=Nepenthes gracilis TaxID=150966 RepID=A0AAD3TDH8_NEPGR|nr:hypothetical protein Nepgr_028772 [Nepenthes gracilis]